MHLFLLQGGKVLLLRRYQTGYEDGNFSVVAGHLDGNETVVAAAMREAREEVGVVLAAQDLRVVGVMHRRSTDERIDWFVVCERWAGEITNAEPEKCDELCWADPERLPAERHPLRPPGDRELPCRPLVRQLRMALSPAPGERSFLPGILQSRQS